MRYLHTMVRVTSLNDSLDFYCNKLGLIEIRRVDSDKGKFILVFLSAKEDENIAKTMKSPLLELTYNWPSENNEEEKYEQGRNFGHLAFEVDNIYVTCTKLQNSGVVINRPPRDGYMAFIKSPDGISIELLQKGDKLPLEEPWISMDNIGTW